MKAYIEQNKAYAKPIRWTLDLVQNHCKERIVFVDHEEEADIVFSDQVENAQSLNYKFFEAIGLGEDPHQYISKYELVGSTPTDKLTSVFYLTNCIQEAFAVAEDEDHFGRFKYESSIQFKEQIITQNLVLTYLHQYIEGIRLTKKEWKSQLFLGHDIDELYSGFLQDGFWALKNKHFKEVLTVIFKHIVGQPTWRNIDQLLAINDEYDVKSTFFWLVENGKGQDGITNSDYNVKREEVLLLKVKQQGSVNGIHKSSKALSFSKEMSKSNLIQPFNRYHFLRFSVKDAWAKMDQEGIVMDTSLGFAEHYGFRNSYGWFFKPYNHQENKSHSVTVAPLLLMDQTIRSYMKMTPQGVEKQLLDFLDQHRKNTVYNILWHNNFYTDLKFKGYLGLLKSILTFMKEERIENITPSSYLRNSL
jgi:hypothetical protein